LPAGSFNLRTFALAGRSTPDRKAQRLDIVVGTRYSAGGSVGDWQGSRIGISNLASRMARLVIYSDRRLS
jgi:hypothetical protein